MFRGSAPRPPNTGFGAGTEAVGTLGITTVADGIRLVDRSVYELDDHMLLAWDVARCC